MRRSTETRNAGAGPDAKCGLAYCQNWREMTPSGDVAQHRVGCVCWGRRWGGGETAVCQRWTSYPWRAGSPADSARTLGVVIGRAPRVLEMNPASNMFCSVKPPALAALVQLISEERFWASTLPSHAADPLLQRCHVGRLGRPIRWSLWGQISTSTTDSYCEHVHSCCSPVCVAGIILSAFV